MKVLLDECIDRRLGAELKGYEVFTVPQAGWAGVKNGELLRLAEPSFDVFVTVDQNLEHEQKIESLNMAVIVLCGRSNRLDDLRSLVPNLLHILDLCHSGTVTRVPSP
jgi:hypothetical protein